MKICCFLFFVTCRPACRANVSARPQAAAGGTSRPVFFVYTGAFPRHSAMFRLPGWPVLPFRTARFALPYGPFCDVKRAELQRAVAQMVARCRRFGDKFLHP